MYINLFFCIFIVLLYTKFYIVVIFRLNYFGFLFISALVVSPIASNVEEIMLFLVKKT